MSSDPNTPDFDSMSPEEVMAWMETLAKRQGADASGFTTDADETIDEIDPDTVDDSVLSQTYRPDGWSEERWQAQLAKEEEEKQARLTQQQQAPPEPEPVVAIPEPESEPEPAVASSEPVASDDGTPDYDNMSPEELMEWMESLAKRQGADEAGFTTKAEMDVAEVDPNTVDDSILNQTYRPDGWSEERWQAQLVKDEEEKQARLAQQRQTPPPPPPEPEPELVDEDEELATLNLDDLPIIDINEEETTAAPDSPMSWLESLATTDEDSEELDIPDLSKFGDDLGVLDSLAQEDAAGDPMDWLSSLAGDVDENPDLDLGDLSDGLADLEGLEAFALLGEDEGEDESLASVGDDVKDPVSFLETLAMQEGAPEDELSTDHNDVIPDLDSFFSEDSVDDIGLGDLLDDTQPSQELEPAWAEDDPNSMENPEAWLEALADDYGDDTGQMTRFEAEDDDDEDDESLLVEPKPDSEVIDALNSGKDVSPEDIQNFFASAFTQAEEYAHLDEGPSESEPEGEVESAVAVDVPDWLQELGVAAPTAQAVGGDDEGEDLMADVLADLENGDNEDIGILDLGGEPDEDVAEQVDIPDWLSDSTDDSLDELEIEEEAEQVGIPDWLSDGAEDDSGDVIADIIADDHNIATGETAVISTESGHEVEVDPNDKWTQAFLMEDHEEDAEEWYIQRLNTIADEKPADAQVVEEEPELDQTTLQMTSPPGAISLEPAALPIEEELPEGQAELAPSWLIGDAVQASLDTQPQLESVAEDSTADIPSWLEDSISDDDNIEIPDWLSDDDTSEDPIPDWLADAGVSQVEPAAIPSWLTDTVEEPADIVAQVVEPEPEVASISIVPPPSPAVDVSGAIKSAQEKVEAGNLDEALQDYESVVRANDNIDVVIKDLQKLTKNDTTKKNPAIYRVLGDAQMRNGDLQTALDTYRRALNLL